MSELADRIEARKQEIAARACDMMYEDPFWAARFGERGRKFSAEDGAYHVTYLLEALRSGNPGVIESYARWLRTVLVTRGMCSRHLAQNFARLAEAIRGIGIEGAEPALAMLRAAEEALVYRSGPAGELQAQGVEDVVSGQPGGSAGGEPGGSAGGGEADGMRGRVLREHLACVASLFLDALALDRGDLFAAHARFMGGLYRQGGGSVEPLRAALDALAARAEGLDGAERERAGAILAEGKRALEEPAQ